MLTVKIKNQQQECMFTDCFCQNKINNRNVCSQIVTIRIKSTTWICV